MMDINDIINATVVFGEFAIELEDTTLECGLVFNAAVDTYVATFIDEGDGTSYTIAAADPYTVTNQMNVLFGQPVPADVFINAIKHFLGKTEK